MRELSEPSFDHLFDPLPELDLDLTLAYDVQEWVDMFADTLREHIDAPREHVDALMEAASVRAAQDRFREYVDALMEAASARSAQDRLYVGSDIVRAYAEAVRAFAHADGFDPVTYAWLKRQHRRLRALVRLLQIIMLGFVRTLIAAATHPDRCCTYLHRLRELCLHYGNRTGPGDHCVLLTRQQPTCQGVAYALN